MVRWYFFHLKIDSLLSIGINIFTSKKIEFGTNISKFCSFFTNLGATSVLRAKFFFHLQTPPTLVVHFVFLNTITILWSMLLFLKLL